ncbi:hypothetical protein [Paenibacillus sinopodophylli]|uniref:hypothetical protein n=1 Tax=Paenibacillus sinopodophylli TaxID=1837342 RepID=UPI00110CC92A|nr:hypothetical protein [Paenibacillus sinopodophylli]
MNKKKLFRNIGRSEWVDLTDEVCAILRKIIIIFVILLIISQAALQNQAVRHWLTGVDQREGTRMN